ncbi:molybdate ABC transporter substrate-binding protein [Desulfobacca acetoxidans]|uniref:Molybdenum ABC transporter, periplasmic molybdate-binding protein n=1 Tax=Desulfobacca acetoxidans (strain ATCC 700848 / DSM 11109 / ASRB2) TaxID=880072 RepID=F2NH82_DESAR|nr:molybdate ABC transporter substrate-binding protein [Desulfobacca acetoxidans]AEB08924.1 molybdenum ABC transporter, periplasmic molybdate-binding protein [Desulfobacca acetoxidans DSM 11109]
MKRIVFLLGIMYIISSSGVWAGAQSEILVSAAISLKNAFTELGQLYQKKHSDVKVSFNFGASGDLARQIQGGAPVAVFASAAQKDMDVLDQAGMLVPGSRKDFAGNGVVLVQPRQVSVKIGGFQDLTRPEIKKIAIGNPKTVPAGRYAMDVINYFKIADVIQPKLVLAENVRQVLDYVSRGEVDAGLVYQTDALTRPKEVQVITLAPPASHKPVVYPLALIKGAADTAAAKEFISLILSAEGQDILKKYGFKPVSKN